VRDEPQAASIYLQTLTAMYQDSTRGTEDRRTKVQEQHMVGYSPLSF